MYFKMNDLYVEIGPYNLTFLSVYNQHGELMDSFEVYPETGEDIYSTLVRHLGTPQGMGILCLAKTIDTYWKDKRALYDIDCELWQYNVTQDKLPEEGHFILKQEEEEIED